MRCKAIAANAFSLLLAAAAAAGTSVEQANEARAMGLIETLSGGDGEAALDYLKNSFTAEEYGSRDPEEWKRIVGMLMGDLKGSEVVGVKAEAPFNLEVHVRGPLSSSASDFPWNRPT